MLSAERRREKRVCRSMKIDDNTCEGSPLFSQEVQEAAGDGEAGRDGRRMTERASCSDCGWPFVKKEETSVMLQATHCPEEARRVCHYQQG